MGILERILQKEEWKKFYSSKLEHGHLSKKEEIDLKMFIENGEYTETALNILNGGTFSPAQKILLNKAKNGKKRTVYTYNREENYILKLMAHLLHEYDGIFAPNLYSFRKEYGVKNAAKNILKTKNLGEYYVYKLDISNYFNSVDLDMLWPKLKSVLEGDASLYKFIRALLQFPYAVYDGDPVYENRGIMAGVPISSFLANLYLSDVDRYFYSKDILYVRYSDDILVFSKSYDDLQKHKAYIKNALEIHGLTVNEKKEFLSFPHEEWTFLGFSYKDGILDISPVSTEKLKHKMRRKARALRRWSDRNHVDPSKAAAVFIKRFNEKFYSNPDENELTWARWFFPVINTDRSLHSIDLYMQDCIRYIATGKRNKSRYNFSYSDMKKLGYISLVNEYYKQREQNKS